MTPVRLLRATGDDALARRASRGDHEAFGVLFSRYQLRLELYCRSILRHDEDARDATQNAMTKAFLALDGREQDVAVRAWLFRIAHNESISLMRRRRPTAELAEELTESGAAGCAPAPAETVELREDLAALLEGIRGLPPRARQALLLRELADLDYASVGTVLGISAGGARQAVFEARTALQADRAGREAPCESIRRELSEADHRRRPARHVRGHLRGCACCRDWSTALDTRRQRLSVLPGAAGLAGGSLWGWLSGALGVGASGTAGAVGTSFGGGLALNGKALAALAAVAAGATPVAVHEVERHAAPSPAETRAATSGAPASPADDATAAVARPATATPVRTALRTTAAPRTLAPVAATGTAALTRDRDATPRPEADPDGRGTAQDRPAGSRRDRDAWSGDAPRGAETETDGAHVAGPGWSGPSARRDGARRGDDTTTQTPDATADDERPTSPTDAARPAGQRPAGQRPARGPGAGSRPAATTTEATAGTDTGPATTTTDAAPATAPTQPVADADADDASPTADPATEETP
ncbi:sigma-70 family RNA polymerase sigma factor [Conexibacter sp. W3-3-2]|uniref:sigma-70 family RNA polymerase sigma factor n=1 Tax=Conexibacter sp. W3-3-2 TaxID=2675227 RepID=UPI0012B702C9|nr:sigma-70 family RNA polymerase sigma factor [Conexibacter sp. W3-3-2]MTD44789.1 sigma-70 family RNA polymerase sigma factor [Conexibacter sp. W3-3-2]